MKKSVLGVDIRVGTLFVIAAFAIALPKAARGDDVTPPRVPADLEVPAGNEVFLVGHAFGTQDYVCLPSSTSASGFAWTLFTPQATLFDDDGDQIITHFFSPNAAGTIRATWQHSRDTSAVFAKLARAPFVDPPFVAPGAIAWLLLEQDGVEAGPTGGDRLTGTTFIHRVNTAGGLAPSTGCAAPSDIGKQAFVPYEADYFFYRNPHAEDAR